MYLMEEEYVLEIIKKDGVICYMCGLCEKPDFVGLHAIQPDEIEAATGIRPHVGLLNHPGDLDKGDKQIIDEMIEERRNKE